MITDDSISCKAPRTRLFKSAFSENPPPANGPSWARRWMIPIKSEEKWVGDRIRL
ncbi:hypothetical protein BaRGS_00007838, partial [Batillaria attramentaria]